MKGNEDGAKADYEPVEVKKAKLQDVILLCYIRNRNSSAWAAGLKKRDIRKIIEEKYPELMGYADYFEDAFDILRDRKSGILPHIKRLPKGHSYVLNEEIADRLIQDHRLASFFVKLAERFEEKSFSFKDLRERFPNEKYIEKFTEELKKMGYISEDLVLKGEDCYLIVLDRYNQEKSLLELIIKERVRRIR